MRKQVISVFLCAIIMTMFLSACGKKEETPSQPTVVEIPVEETVTTQTIEEDEKETVEDEVATTQKDKGQTTDSKQVGSSTPKKNSAVATRSSEAVVHQHQYEADVKELEAQRDALLAQSMSNNVTTRSASDDSKEDSEDDKSEDSITNTPTVTPNPEYPLTDADPLAKNIEVLNSALWRERLNGNPMFSLPVKDFYFASKDVTASQMKQEIDSLIGQVPCVKDITYVTSQKDGIDLDSHATVYVEEDALFGSRQAFDDAYAKAKSEHVPIELTLKEDGITEEGLREIELLNIINSVENEILSMSEEEMNRFRLSIYEFMLMCALECNTPQTQDTVKINDEGKPYVVDICEVPFEDFVDHFFEYKGLYNSLQQYYYLKAKSDKELYVKMLCPTIDKYVKDICFWYDSVSQTDNGTLQLKFTMFPVYETVEAPDGNIVMDKSRYKSIATMVKEVDDKINQVIADVIEPGMSTLAKEYALFHYCDTFFEYDSGDDLGGAYAIGDNPYTIVSPIDPATGKKDSGVALYSTQGKRGIYTTAMTGWGVCVGHGRFFQNLCTKVGIKCDYVGREGHAWNRVQIGGKGYLVDAGKRAPYPHFNITHEWSDTYRVIDPKISSIISGDAAYADSGSPIPLYQAGYVEATTQQDGEWVYYINFDDNGSLYKINVDGSGNTKVCDSETTIEAAYDWLTRPKDEPEGQTDQAKDESEDKEEQAPTVPDLWAVQWANAQYGTEYSGQGYTNPGAIDYRWALGHNFQLLKEDGEIIYKVNNISRVTEIPMLKNREEIINLTCNMNDAYYNLGILSGTATINTSRSLGDRINSVVFYVDGIEYPASQMTESEDGQSVDFTFRLPTDKGMEHHDLEILATTINGGAKRQKVMTQTLHPTGIKESYLWNGKYYTVEGITAKEGQLTIFVKRYTKDGQADGVATLSFTGYIGLEAMNVPFHSYKEAEDIFRIELSGGTEYWIQLTTDENVAVEYTGELKEPEMSPDGTLDIYCFANINRVYLFTAKGFCMLAEMMENGQYLDATVEVCADLDFSALPEDVSFKPIGHNDTAYFGFTGTWKGNNYKMKGITLDVTGDACIFETVGKATIQDVYICDSSVIGTESAAIFRYFDSGASLKNLWVEDVTISGDEYVGVIGTVFGGVANVQDAYLMDLTVKGNKYVGGFAGEYSGTIDGLQVLGNSEVIGNSYVGGIVGRYEFANKKMSIITNCLSEAKITATGNYVGGIAGEAWQIAGISYCMNYGHVRTDGDYVGGIAGKADRSWDIYHVENYGTVCGNKYVGGIAGYSSGTSYDTVVAGAVEGEDYVGGVAGYFGGSYKVRLAYNSGTLSGTEQTGGICGYVSENAQIYNTLAYGSEKLTSESIAVMFGETEGDITIITDTEPIPADAGRQAYCRD